MQLQKNINLLNGNEDISIIYTKTNFVRSNTSIAIYNKYKISILFSDGLNAIMGNKVIRTSTNSVLFFRPDEIHFGQISRSGIYSYTSYIGANFFTENAIEFQEITDHAVIIYEIISKNLSNLFIL